MPSPYRPSAAAGGCLIHSTQKYIINKRKRASGRPQIYRPPIPRVAIPVSALARGGSRTGVPAPTESRPDHPLRNHYTTLPTLYMLDEPTNDEVPLVCCAAIVRRFTIQHRHIVHTSGYPCGDHTASHQSTTPLNFSSFGERSQKMRICVL
jgi:hypothetical protein